MHPIYLFVEKNGIVRKIMVDMAYLSAKKKIRLLKYLYEDGLYFLYPDSKDNSSIEKYFLTKDKVVKEDKDFYYFKFPFSIKAVSEVSH
jgi:hypothetical protein